MKDQYKILISKNLKNLAWRMSQEAIRIKKINPERCERLTKESEVVKGWSLEYAGEVSI